MKTPKPEGSKSAIEILDETADGLLEVAEFAREMAADIREDRDDLRALDLEIETALGRCAERVSFVYRKLGDALPWSL